MDDSSLYAFIRLYLTFQSVACHFSFAPFGFTFIFLGHMTCALLLQIQLVSVYIRRIPRAAWKRLLAFSSTINSATVEYLLSCVVGIESELDTCDRR